MGRVSGERFECPPPLLGEKVGFVLEDVREAQEESARHERLTLDRERLGASQSCRRTGIEPRLRKNAPNPPPNAKSLPKRSAACVGR